MMRPVDLSVYLVTHYDLCPGEAFFERVEACCAAGVGVVQLREKTADGRLFLARARRLREITRRYGVALIVNDRVDVALLVEADGVHVGQSDLPLSDVRALLGPERIVGVSVHNLAELQAAVADGADYVGAGALFDSSGLRNVKNNATLLSLAELGEIVAHSPIPVVAIGGIDVDNVKDVLATGCSGVAVVRALHETENVQATVLALRGVHVV
ncbi:MAG: thiamine phosphate synthase [Bacilli bacterium]